MHAETLEAPASNRQPVDPTLGGAIPTFLAILGESLDGEPGADDGWLSPDETADARNAVRRAADLARRQTSPLADIQYELAARGGTISLGTAARLDDIIELADQPARLGSKG